MFLVFGLPSHTRALLDQLRLKKILEEDDDEQLLDDEFLLPSDSISVRLSLFSCRHT